MAPIPWTGGETLLALELAHDLEWINPRSDMPAVVDLALLLGRGPFHPGIELPSNFRNPNAVKMKVSNLVWHHSDGMRGLRSGAGQDHALIQLYRADPALMLRLAGDLRAVLKDSRARERPAA